MLMRQEAAFPFVFAAEGAQHPPNKPPRSPALAASSATSDKRWSERNIRYDPDGNLLHLERYQDNANMPQATLDFRYDGPKRVGYAYDSNGNITCDPFRCFEIRYNLLNLSADVIGHDTEDTAAEGTLLSETVYYADGTRAGVTTPDDGYWTTRYIGSLIYEGEICTKEV